MKKILVPCDFSKPAINAYRFALDIASQSKGEIHLLHVIELPVMYDTVVMPVLNYEEQFLKELRERAESQFNKINEKYRTEGVKVTFNIEFGPVSRMIVEYIERESIDLVLMGSHGASGVRELFIGSNAEKIVRRSPVPVLVMKTYYKGAVKNIVFPNMFETEDQEDLVMKVKALQRFFKAHLHLVWINTPLTFESDTVSHERLRTFAKRFMLKDCTVHVFNHTDEERGILDFTNFIKGDLIAIGTHGRRGIAHLVNGSLAEDIVNHNKGLVWTYSLRHEPVKV